MTPLSLACEAGNAELVQELLKGGADANQTLPNGETPLMMAARTGRLPVIELLLAKGAKINEREKLRGTTALMWAAANSNADAVRLLIARGAEINARSRHHGARSAAVPRRDRPLPNPGVHRRTRPGAPWWKWTRPTPRFPTIRTRARADKRLAEEREVAKRNDFRVPDSRRRLESRKKAPSSGRPHAAAVRGSRRRMEP